MTSVLSGVHTARDIVRCRPVSLQLNIVIVIDLTAVFTYRTMSYDSATTLTQCVNCRTTTSCDIGRHRPVSLCRPTSCVKASSAVVRCRAQCEHRYTLDPPVYINLY